RRRRSHLRRVFRPFRVTIHQRESTHYCSATNLMEWWPFAVSAACAGMLMPLAIHARSIGHGDFNGIQSLHDVPTSRLGGVVVVVACAITMAMVLSYGQDKGFAGLPLVLAVVPVVLLGLAEDLTRQIRPRY